MGLLDYYRQFEDMDESEVNEALRERRAREKALALERVPVLDLSGTEWPELPNAEVVSASVYQARGRLNGYPDPEATQVRRAAGRAPQHPWRADRVGNGAAELVRSRDRTCSRPSGTRVVVPRPSQRVYPAIAARAGARSWSRACRTTVADAEALLRASVTDAPACSCSATRTTRPATYLPSARLGELLSRLPEHVHVLLDEAYIQFQDVEAEDACMRLVEAFPRLLVVRTFSKVYGLSGLRAGYAVGSRRRNGAARRRSRRRSASTRSRRPPCCRPCASATRKSSSGASRWWRNGLGFLTHSPPCP